MVSIDCGGYSRCCWILANVLLAVGKRTDRKGKKKCALVKNVYFYIRIQRVREEYVAALFRQDTAWFERTTAGDISTRIVSDVLTIQEGTGSKVGTVFMVSLSLFPFHAPPFCHKSLFLPFHVKKLGYCKFHLRFCYRLC